MVFEICSPCSQIGKKIKLVSYLFIQGYHPSFLENSWKVTKGSIFVSKGNKVGSLYIFLSLIEVGDAMNVIGIDVLLGHHRLGHMIK